MNLANDTTFAAQFGEFLFQGRLARGLSQKELAEAVNIGQPYYSYIEKGQRNVDLVLAMKLCQCLSLDLNEFIQNCHSIL